MHPMLLAGAGIQIAELERRLSPPSTHKQRKLSASVESAIPRDKPFSLTDIKTYESSQQETRYSPATITGSEKVVRFGDPDESKISTSSSERFNLTVRMANRRMTRLTNAHSKKAEHHSAMMSLTTAYYNFCRR